MDDIGIDIDMDGIHMDLDIGISRLAGRVFWSLHLCFTSPARGFVTWQVVSTEPSTRVCNMAGGEHLAFWMYSNMLPSCGKNRSPSSFLPRYSHIRACGVDRRGSLSSKYGLEASHRNPFLSLHNPWGLSAIPAGKMLVLGMATA